jgi:hypothetical protein
MYAIFLLIIVLLFQVRGTPGLDEVTRRFFGLGHTNAVDTSVAAAAATSTSISTKLYSAVGGRRGQMEGALSAEIESVQNGSDYISATARGGLPPLYP